MATSTQSNQKKADFKEEFLTCSICTELFDNGEHEAKYLPCLHSYCKSCLKQHAGSKPTFKCPNCCKEVTLPGKSVDNLPHNFLVESLKEHLDVLNFSVFCGNCDKENKAVRFCHDCGCFQCQECVDNHCMKILKHHSLSTLAELQERKSKPTVRQHCKKHPLQHLSLYCKEDGCKVPVCAVCALVNHKDHDLDDLEVVADEVEINMKRLVKRVTDKKDQLVHKNYNLYSAKTQLTKNFDQQVTEMMSGVKKIHHLIDTAYNNAKKSIDQLRESKIRSLTIKKEEQDSLTAQMSSACEFATGLCNAGDSIHLLTSQTQIMDRLKELENVEIPHIDPSKIKFVFTEQHNAAISKAL